MVRQRVVDLRGGWTQIYGFNLDAKGYHGYLHTVRYRDGTVTNKLSDMSGDVGCDVRTVWRLRRDLIRVSIPRECVAHPGALRSNTYIAIGDGSAGDPTDWTKTVRVGRS